MKVNHLKLINFRNYQSVECEFKEGINLIYGLNASGKTNLVEAIGYLSLGKSFRTNEESSLIKNGEEFLRVEAIFQNKRSNTLKLVLTNKGKMIEHNDVKINKLSELSGLLLTLAFVPDDVSMFKDSPSIRRRFLDINLSGIYRQYINALSEYRSLLKNRNALLKEEDVDLTYLEVLEDSLIKPQYLIATSRAKLIKQLEEKINQVFKTIGREKENQIKIEYLTEFSVSKTFEEFKEEVKGKYFKERENDLRKKNTGIGVHKDDFKIYLNNLDVSIYASQGQNRLISLSLKLSLARLIKELTNQDPIIILDDVLSELDNDHQQRLIEELRNYEQVFITSAKDEQIENINKYQVIDNVVIRRN